MGWQEEESLKRAVAADAKALGLQRHDRASKKIDELWNKIVEANKRLAPNIKCKHEGRILIGQGAAISNDYSPPGKFMYNFHDPAQYRGIVSVNPLNTANATSKFVFIYFDVDLNRFRVYEGWGEHLDDENCKPDTLGIHGKYFKFNEEDIDVLLRNLCTCRSLTGGFTKENCFIATAVYGPGSIEVSCFQNFRGGFLIQYLLGRLFVRFYYFVSPCLANVLSSNSLPRNFVRQFVLNPLFLLLSRFLNFQCTR